MVWRRLLLNSWPVLGAIALLVIHLHVTKTTPQDDDIGLLTELAPVSASAVLGANGGWGVANDAEESEAVDPTDTREESPNAAVAAPRESQPKLVSSPPLAAAVPGSDETPARDNWDGKCRAAPDVCTPDLVVSLSDIASFTASAPVLAEMQPSGWALKRLPMNLVATASVEEIAGELLGFPATVRFTPVGYLWDYGDATTRNTVTGGASWEALGVPELSQTATSHAYRERGEYSVTVTVVLSAEYRFAGRPWRPIAGTLQVVGAPSPVSVKTVRTVLVRGSCLEYPNDPGC